MAETRDITATAQALAAGSCRASDLLERSLSRIERYQGALNAFVCLDIENARIAAQASEARHRCGAARSALDGIPIALKDNIHVDGFATRNGTAWDFPGAEEAEVAQKLRAAGAVLLGKLNMDECALGAVTDNPHHGRTDNPWRSGHTAGGSSGGAGAAVASGMAMAALGTDTLGSVRLPAAYCGIVGLKPTRGAISTSGVVALSPSLDHVGPLCRSVRDAALLLGVLTGTAPRGATDRHDGAADLGGLRLGIFAPAGGADWTADVARGFERALATLRTAGATVTSLAMPDADFARLRRGAFLLIEHDGANGLAAPLRDHPQSFSHAVRAMFDYGRNASDEKLAAARAGLAGFRRASAPLFDRVDLLISPTAPQTAFALDGPTPANQADLTAAANICGWPAISLPSGLDWYGLPLAVQLTAPPGRDAELLRAAMAMESLWGTFCPTMDLQT